MWPDLRYRADGEIHDARADVHVHAANTPRHKWLRVLWGLAGTGFPQTLSPVQGRGAARACSSHGRRL